MSGQVLGRSTQDPYGEEEPRQIHGEATPEEAEELWKKASISSEFLAEARRMIKVCGCNHTAPTHIPPSRESLAVG